MQPRDWALIPIGNKHYSWYLVDIFGWHHVPLYVVCGWKSTFVIF